MSEPPRRYSILARVRRVTSEDAYISVPVTERILTPRDDGTMGIDTDQFWAEAVRLSADQRVTWATESTDVTTHPIQQPLPEDRRAFDPLDAEAGASLENPEADRP
jgi:hypothetical protein